MAVEMKMPTYRFHGFSLTGLKAPGRDVVCLDDAEAIILAKKMARGQSSCEVWFGDKLVSSLFYEPAETEQELPWFRPSQN